MKSSKRFLLRISPELYEALEASAQQEFRSVNGQIEYVLREAVRKRRKIVTPDGDTPLSHEPEPPADSSP